MNYIKLLSTSTKILIALTALASLLHPSKLALAESAEDVFKTMPVGKGIGWLAVGGYKLMFVPNGRYSYQIQVVGQTNQGEWTCKKKAAVKLEDIQWGKIKAEVGFENTTVSGNVVADGDVVSLMGRNLIREPNLSRKMHFRVVAQKDNNEVAYRSNWHPEEIKNLYDWENFEACKWVVE